MNKNALQALKFTLFSLSAGIVQIASFALLHDVLGIESWWMSYVPSLILSVIWNFTFNRKYTFKPTGHLKRDMLLVAGYYLVFTPASALFGTILEALGLHDWLVEIIVMLLNFITEFLFQSLVVYNEKPKNKAVSVLGYVVLAVTIIYTAIGLWPRGQNFPQQNPMIATGDLPILIAHGGGNREFPDNTLEAFYNAYSVDPRAMMETDVSITADGVVILSHDVTLDRKTNVTGAIADWTYADLMAQKVDFGYTNKTKSGVLVEGTERVRFVGADGAEKTPLDVAYPQGVSPRDEAVFLATTLEELILAFPDTPINVEIKQSGETGLRCLHEVVRLLRDHDAFDRVVLASFHDEIYAEFQRMQAAGEVPAEFMYSPSTGAATTFFVLQMLKLDLFFDDGMCVFQLPLEELGFNLATSGLINAAHNHNLAVHYWTINDPDEMRMLIDLSADGIMTDYPHRLAEVYAEYAEAE